MFALLAGATWLLTELTAKDTTDRFIAVTRIDRALVLSLVNTLKNGVMMITLIILMQKETWVRRLDCQTQTKAKPLNNY